ncbi:MAG: hypothetical protein MJ224_06390, partial [archaeon]|nr:hypothetical protein [archaeon]
TPIRCYLNFDSDSCNSKKFSLFFSNSSGTIQARITSLINKYNGYYTENKRGPEFTNPKELQTFYEQLEREFRVKNNQFINYYYTESIF